MNILYINHYAGSPEMGMEFRPYYLAREWTRMGHKVTIVAGDYSHLRKNNPGIADDFTEEVIDGITYVWLKTGVYSGNGVKRALTMFRFVRKLRNNSKKMADKYRPDVVVASSTYPLDSYAAVRIARKAGAKYVHEVHDMWPATLYEVGGMSKANPFVVVMQIAENHAYKHCDTCVSLLPYAKEYMMKHGLASEKFVNIQNGIVEEEWESSERIPDEHRDFFEQHKGEFIVGYFGGHALSNALDNCLDVAKEMLSDEGTTFVLVGDGVEKEGLMKRAKEEEISNVFFLPPVNKKAVPDLITYFDCSFMTGKTSPLYRFGLCLNKMYDSMMAGIPIVCAFDAPDTLVRIYDCGIQCDPNNISEVAEAIRTIRNMPAEEKERLGQNARSAVLEHFTYRHLAEDFVRLAFKQKDM